MKKIEFEIKKEDEFFEYHLPVGIDKFLEQTIQQGNGRISGKLINQVDEWSEFYKNYCYTWQCEENVFVYLLIIFKLLKNKSIYAIPCWDVSMYLNIDEKEYDLIDWQYSIEYQLDESFENIEFRDKGFVNAKSSTSQPENPKWTNDKENKTALIKIESAKDCINLLSAVRHDVYGEVNLFVLNEEQNHEQLTKSLQETYKPNISNILDNVELLIDLVIGDDDGYQDYLIIKSKKDISKQLNEISETVTQKSIEYEQALNSIDTFADFESLIIEKFELKSW
jgi:hypothetical protein